MKSGSVSPWIIDCYSLLPDGVLMILEEVHDGRGRQL